MSTPGTPSGVPLLYCAHACNNTVVLVEHLSKSCSQWLSDSKRNAQDVNFGAVWEEYDRLRQLRGHADHYSRPVAARAFETLLSRRLLLHADPRRV